jgi:AraC-like DNA-binding protein
MAIKQIFYNTFSNRAQFEMTYGSRPWDVFLLLVDGEFEIEMCERKLKFGEKEVLYIPAHTYIQRKILKPITFHQFAFVTDGLQPFYSTLSAGKINIAKEQVVSIIQTMENSTHVIENNDVVCHCIERIMCEHFISTTKTDESIGKFSSDIQNTLVYLRNNFQNRIQVKELADKVGLSYTGFLWKFEKQVGITPSEYLASIRMRYAKHLLTEGALSIGQISEQCGYSNPYYFTNVFKSTFGVSPTAFKKLQVKL